jgi:quercetin dioxygenase-like cupin family protein
MIASLPLVVILAWIGVRFGPEREGPPVPTTYDTGDARSAAVESAFTREIGRSRDASVHHLVATGNVPGHYHRFHDETVVILRGEGLLTLDAETREVRPGTVLLLPRGSAHRFAVTGAPMEAVSVFSPPLDDADRHFPE